MLNTQLVVVYYCLHGNHGHFGLGRQSALKLSVAIRRWSAAGMTGAAMASVVDFRAALR
jgi:hypothetical protein